MMWPGVFFTAAGNKKTTLSLCIFLSRCDFTAGCSFSCKHYTWVSLLFMIFTCTQENTFQWISVSVYVCLTSLGFNVNSRTSSSCLCKTAEPTFPCWTDKGSNIYEYWILGCFSWQHDVLCSSCCSILNSLFSQSFYENIFTCYQIKYML